MQTSKALIDSAATPAPEGDAASVPSRLIARFVSEVQLSTVAAMVEALEVHCGRSITFDRAIVLMVIMRAGPHFNCASTGLAVPPEELNRAISINAIAASLGRPFETVRRHVNALVGAGVCVRTPRGIVMQVEIATLPALHRAVRRAHDLMVLLVDYVRAHGITLPRVRPDRPYVPSATIAATLDLVLAAAEYLDPHYEDWLEMAVVNAVMAANARPITFDPVLAWRYCNVDTVPPETLRVPVSVAHVARALHIPYSTAQRQVNRSIAKGQVRRVRGGIMVTTGQLHTAAVRIAGPAATARAMRAFGRLVPGGFRFDAPGDCYLDGAPPLLDFGLGSPTPIASPVSCAVPVAGN